MGKTFKERSVERIPAIDLVYYSDPFHQFDPSQHVASHVAITDNISDNGACIFTSQAFRQGEKVKLKFRGLKKPPLVATVKWCNKSSDQLYRVGLFWPNMM